MKVLPVLDGHGASCGDNAENAQRIDRPPVRQISPVPQVCEIRVYAAW